MVLDEPTTGLDPAARHMVWQRLRLLRSQGVTMLLTTHYMEEAAQLCDRVVIIHQGKIIAEGTPEELIQQHAGQASSRYVTPEERPGVMRRWSK
jgi:lipooligosaccharide transport system ATP-binding protein